MPPLIWTEDPPKEPGWYWRRSIRKKDYDFMLPEIVYVRWFCGDLCISNWKITKIGYQWAGPIFPP